MSEGQIEHEVMGDGVVVMRLNRPPVNALNPSWLGAIHDAANALDGDASVRAVVLAGAGKVLSAGMDLKELQGFSIADQRAMVHGLNRTYTRLYGLSKPLVCAAHGAAIAGGLFFVLVSDYRIAGEHATFGLAEVKVGVRFPVGPAVIAMNELSPSACRRFMLGAANHDANTALALQVVDEVLPTEEVLPRAVAVARDYAALPGAAFAHTKRTMRAHALSRLRVLDHPATEPMLDGWFSDETYTATTAMLATLAKR